MKYVYNKISYFENGEQKEMIYGVTIDCDETISSRIMLPLFLPLDTELASDMMFRQQFSVMMYIFLNSMLSFIYDAVDLQEQMNTKLYGFGTLKYERLYSVDGKNGTYTGTKVALYNEDGELSMSWMIDPNIPFALKTYMGDDYEDDSTTITFCDYALS